MHKPILIKRKFSSRLKPFSGAPQWVSLVNVFFLLLIFFIISSSFIQVSGIVVEMPRIPDAGIANMEKFIITVSSAESGGLIYFNDRSQTWDTLAEELAATRRRSRSGSVIVRADKSADHGTVARVLNMVANANLKALIEVRPSKVKAEAKFGQ